jgi:hypothetical protein
VFVILLKRENWAVDEWNGMTPACAKAWEDMEPSPSARLWTDDPRQMKQWPKKKDAVEIARRLRPEARKGTGRVWVRVVAVEDLDAYMVGNVLTR